MTPIPPSPPLFTFNDVSVRFGDNQALRSITVDLAGEGITVIVGPSGSGKSTLLRLCNRLEVPTSGSVSFYGTGLGAIDPLKLRRQVGMVFQRSTLFGGSVRDNLRVAAPEGESAYGQALESAGLNSTFLDRQAAELSGGEAQRACIARTLVTKPEAMLMDEPTSALDESSRLDLERVARELAKSGVPLIWVTHDLQQVERIADFVIELEEGEIVSTSHNGGSYGQ